MKKGFIFLSAFILLISSLNLFSNLTILDPRNTWKSCPGTIDSMNLDIFYEGIYARVEATFVIGIQNPNTFYNNDSLEVEMKFTLPENSFIRDSWLYIDTYWSQAKIIDRNTANLIYENIVKRRRDPSILYKNSQTDYEFRIFPIPNKKTRKVRLSFMIPLKYNGTLSTFNLPFATDMKSSYFQTPKITNIRVQENDYLSQINLGGLVTFKKSVVDSVKYMEAQLKENEYTLYKELNASNPLTDNKYFSISEKPDGKYYQLVFNTNELLKTQNPRKILYMINYHNANVNVTFDVLLDELKKSTIFNLSSQDSFNIVYASQGKTKTLGKWFSPTDTKQVDSLFQYLKDNNISNYSMLLPLFDESFKFLNENGKTNVNMIILSSSAEYCNVNIANSVINDIMSKVPSKVSLNFIDLSYDNSCYISNNGVTYFGNDYLFINLADFTNGISITDVNLAKFNTSLVSIYDKINNSIVIGEINLDISNGFSYSNTYLSGSLNANTITKGTNIIIGKIAGDGDYKLKIKAEIDGKLIMKEIPLIIKDEDIHTDLIWQNQYIKTLENISNPSNDVKREMIKVSIRNRILSRLTAFLALEISDTTQQKADPDKNGGNGNTDIDEIEIDELIKISPNPLVSSSMIEINQSNISSVEIFDFEGKLIYRFDVNLNNDKYQLRWDGIDMYGNVLPAGTYLLVVNTAGKSYSKKLIIAR